MLNIFVIAFSLVVFSCSSLPLGFDGDAGRHTDEPTPRSLPADAALEGTGARSAMSLDAESDAPEVGGPDSGLSPAPEASPHVVAASDAITSDAMADADGDAPDSLDARDAPDAFDAPEADAAPSAAPSACVPVNCGTHSWGCWRMPNSPNSDLPNPAHYTDMGDGTVRDDVTCLLWQKTAPTDTAYTWSDAKAKCTGNPLLGGVGWRLPSRIELISIVDYTRRDPSIPVLAFPSTRPNPPYWTWSPLPSTTDAFAVSFHVGEVLHADQSTMYLARCVRGGGEIQDLPAKAPADHYLIGADEVADQYTGLVWQRADSATLAPSPLQWADAAQYCSTLDQGGWKWRLPSVKELATLVDETRVETSTAIDPRAFPAAMAADYWTSTRIISGSGAAAAYSTVSFVDGRMGTASNTAYARCVR